VYQVLARKWRPKKFDDVIGQDHITRTLVNSIQNEKVAHAYLFTGTRGVGKTTIARIFAKSLKCENRNEDFNPCGECSSCKSIDASNSLDYVEIDGASNNGVDKIRDLIDNVQYLPVSGKYKVYVIDEVHMLSTGAFNALLKTLEEPPAHVVFIFATTDPHKLLGTVLSRCQRFDFKSVDESMLVEHVKKISIAEEIKFESDDLLNILAKHGDGSVRDTLSLLDQVISLSSSDVINQEEMYQALGLINQGLIDNVLRSILSKDSDLFKDSIVKVKSENISHTKFLAQLLDSLYEVINNLDNDQFFKTAKMKDVNQTFLTGAELMWIYETIIKDSNWALTSFDIMRSIEFIILKTVQREEVLGIETSKKKVKKQRHLDLSDETPEQSIQQPVNQPIEKEEVIKEDVQQEKAEPLQVEETVEDEVQQEKVEIPVIATPDEVQYSEKSWANFFKFARSENKAISVNLERAIHAQEFDHESIWLRYSNEDKIFKDFLSEPNNYNVLIEMIAKFCEIKKEKVRLRIEIIDDETKSIEKLMNKVEKDELSDIKNKEMLENQIKSNKFVRQAQELFNTNISKIVLKMEDEE